MIDRQQAMQILRGHQGSVLDEKTLAAVEAEMLGKDEWTEVTAQVTERLGLTFSSQCEDICTLAEEVKGGAQFRFFRKRA